MSLVSSLDFEDEESFTHKVTTVKESYFKNDEVSSDQEEISEDLDVDQNIQSSSLMDQYLATIRKTHKN